MTVDLDHGLHLMNMAWKEVHPDVVVNSFTKAGFKNASIVASSAYAHCDLVNDFDKFVDIDETLLADEASAMPSDDEEVSVDIRVIPF